MVIKWRHLKLILRYQKRVDQKNFCDFNMSIDEAGSARAEHEKILIFDFSLLFCPADKSTAYSVTHSRRCI